jgi:hypothetical protein
VSIRFQADNDLNSRIVAAALRREPGIDFRTAQAAQLDSLDDQAVLDRAASDGRILVTHDKRTMPKQLSAFVASGNHSPGVLLVVPQSASLAVVVETLILIWADDRPADWENAITIIPF